MNKENFAIECKNITKTFGPVIANDEVNLDLKYGEILALLGENGSGKTTLVNMISGIYHPDGGEIFVGGKKVHINSPTDAINLGIGMIHQHYKLVEVMSAMDNIAIGTKGKLPKPKDLKKEIEEISTRFGLEIDPEKKVYDMSISEKQTVEVLKVLYKGATTLILDEPTAVLTPQEIDKLFIILDKMRSEGCAVIIITHKLNEVMSISDRVTVLRRGKAINTVITKESNEKELTEIMVGKAVDLHINRPTVLNNEVIVKAENLTICGEEGVARIRGIDFEMKTGEILGVAGVAGSGQKELCESLIGLVPYTGDIVIKGQNICAKTPGEISKMGVALSFVPEDRLGMGLVPSMGMVGNMMIKNYNDGPGIFIDTKPARALSERLVEELEIKTPNVDTPVRMLSGGNIQKILLGREIEADPQVLIVSYPVRGLDIHSSHTIYDLLNEQKEKGVAILFVGEDLDVLLEISDRIMVLCHGEVSGIVDATTISKESIGLMMTGIKEAELR